MIDYNIEKDKEEITKIIKEYVRIILNEYKDIPSNIREKLKKIKDFSFLVKIHDTKTISLYVTSDSVIHLPIGAYHVINELAKLEEYGSNKKHQTHDNNNMILNDNTYLDFVEHIILKGATPIEYFKEILLHEVMHMCGSDGAYALAEGFNELKTRELALKYNLETSCCGYPKETRIAYLLQELFGKDICDRLIFKDLNERLNILNKEIGEDAARLYLDVFNSMEPEFNPYINKKYPGINGIKNKCLSYEAIDYSVAYNYINQYKNNRKR